jgi:hypothetical protein
MEKIQNENKILNIQIGLFRLEIEDMPEEVFQETLLNALTHRCYQNMATVYVKHYPDKVVIENPGGFMDGITEKNIITHPSMPRNKLIAETLQHLKYVQRTGQGVDIIFREMISMGKPYPKYRVYNEAVSLTIENVTDNVSFAKLFFKEQEMQQKAVELWYPVAKRPFETVVAVSSLLPVVAYCLYKIAEWGFVFQQCKVCGNDFLARSRHYELCSDVCRKEQAVAAKREFDERAKGDRLEQLDEAAYYYWYNRLRKLRKGKAAEKTAAFKAAFDDFRKEAVRRKGEVKHGETRLNDFAAWLVEWQSEADG